MAFYPVPPAVPPVPRFKRHHATRPMELDDLGHEGSECNWVFKDFDELDSSKLGVPNKHQITVDHIRS